MLDRLARRGIQKYIAAYDKTMAKYPDLPTEVGGVIVAISEMQIDPADAIETGVSNEDKRDALFAIESFAVLTDSEKKHQVNRFNKMSDVASKGNLPTSLFMAPRILSCYIRSTMLNEAKDLQTRSTLKLSDMFGETPLHLSIFHRISSAINLAKEA